MSFNAQNGGNTFSEVRKNPESNARRNYFHGLLVALSLTVGGGTMAQDKPVTLIASADTSSTSAPATADKGVGQIINTQYGPLSFAEIAKHPEKKSIVDALSDAEFNAFDTWMENRIQAVISQNTEKREVLVASNQEVDKIAEQRQQVNQDVGEQRKEIIAKMYAYQSAVDKGTIKADQEMIQIMLKEEFVPTALKEWARKQQITTAAL